MWLTGKLIGKGAFSKVYDIENVKKGWIHYAAKFSLGNQDAKRALQNEINIHSEIVHPNIVTYINSFTTLRCSDLSNSVIEPYTKPFGKGTCKVLILEICENKSVEEMMKLRGNLLEPEAKYIVYHIALALKYLKKHNILHRDVKPANIMLCSGMKPKLGDFGLSVKLDSHAQRIKRLIGSPSYSAPELIEKNYSFGVDLWALGVTFYFLITGSLPFVGKSREDLFEKIKALKYSFPVGKNPSPSAKSLISKIFTTEKRRITVEDLLVDPLFETDMLEKLPYESRAVKPSQDTLSKFKI